KFPQTDRFSPGFTICINQVALCSTWRGSRPAAKLYWSSVIGLKVDTTAR
ncbi:uncharacterized protein PgNI_00107, partial [Pyricularia grisea]|uniref:Uncharacterized protein n=1 Tax=Pyricularia grisea TaxID=148305 RepID=A0A6P8BJM4_PYRGI